MALAGMQKSYIIAEGKSLDMNKPYSSLDQNQSAMKRVFLLFNLIYRPGSVCDKESGSLVRLDVCPALPHPPHNGARHSHVLLVGVIKTEYPLL